MVVGRRSCGTAGGFGSVTFVTRGFQIHCAAVLLHDFGFYWVLAEQRHGRAATMARLEEVALLETQALTGVLAHADDVRMHSVGLEGG